MTAMIGESGGGARTRWIAAAVAALALLALAPAAQAQAPDCKALSRRIADFDKRANSSLSDRYERSARKQRDEIDRTVSYGEQSGCWTHESDEPPPALCRQLDNRLARMRANLDDLQARADEASRSGWDGGESREALVYDYQLWCQGANAPAGNGRRLPIDRIPADDAVRIDGDLSPGAGVDLSPGSGVDLKIPDIAPSAPSASVYGDADPNAVALCVRVCDGGYFPLTAPVKPGKLEGLQALCSAQCPATEARVYTMKKGEDVSKAAASNGDFYDALPNAFKFRKKYDPACACKPAGKTWGQVLNQAEKILEEQTGKSDPAVADGLPKIPAPALRGGDADAALGQPKPPQPKPARPEPARPAAGRAGKPGAIESAPLAPPVVAPRPAVAPTPPAAVARPDDGAEYREVVGPDGVKRRIRIVGPKQ